MNVAFWTTTGAAANIRGGATFVGVALPSAMAVLAVVGLIAVVATALRRTDPDAGELGALLRCWPASPRSSVRPPRRR